MKNFVLSQLIPLVLPLILGPLTTFIVAWMKQGIAALNAAPDVVKRAVLVAVAFVLGGIAHLITTPGLLPNACVLGDAMQCLTAFTEPNAVSVVLTAIIAHILHKDQQQKAAQPAT